MNNDLFKLEAILERMKLIYELLKHSNNNSIIDDCDLVESILSLKELSSELLHHSIDSINRLSNKVLWKLQDPELAKHLVRQASKMKNNRFFFEACQHVTFAQELVISPEEKDTRENVGLCHFMTDKDGITVTISIDGWSFYGEGKTKKEAIQDMVKRVPEELE